MQSLCFEHLSIAIFAAGQSSRFPYPLGKIAYPLDEKPILLHSVDKALERNYREILLILSSKNFDWLQKTYPEYLRCPSIQIVIQHVPLGTGDALRLALNATQQSRLLIMHADCPLVSFEVCDRLSQSCAPAALATSVHPFPRGYGRIMRDKKDFLGIVEEKEIAFGELSLSEINCGVYCFDVSMIQDYLHLIHQDHAKNEYYLTDLWAPGSPLVEKTEICFFENYRQFQGINTWEDFELAEQYYYQQRRYQAVCQGAVLSQVNTVFFKGQLPILEQGTQIRGPVVLRNHNILKTDSQIHPFSYLDTVQIGAKSIVGPFTALSQSTSIGSSCEIGSFVEIKRSSLDQNTKAKHFAYLADCTIGKKCNIAAFVVTCNYDGHKKHTVCIEDEVFIGASSQLVAPLKIGYKAYVGAATLVTEDVPCATLLTRRAASRLRAFDKERFLCVESSQP